MRDQMKITVIATGFDTARQTLREFVTPASAASYAGGGNSYGQSINQQSEEDNSNNQNISNQNNNIPNNMPGASAHDEPDEEVWDIPAFLRQKN